MSDHTARLSDTRLRPAQRTSRAITTLPLGLARPVLINAMVLGLAGDLLLRAGLDGPAFAIWIALVALALVSLVWRAQRNVPAESQWWLAVAVLFAAAMSWRDSDDVQVLNALAVIGSIALAVVTLSQGGTDVLTARLRDTVISAIGPALAVMRGIVPLAVRGLFAPGARDGWMATARPAVRATLIAGVLLAVFGSLLASADPIFASIVSLPAIELDTIASHVLLVGFFAWLTGGLATGALEESDGLPRRAGAPPFSLGMVDITTALATLGVLFATFVLVQIGAMFGGEAFLRARTGLTAAEYARRGFFEMTWVVVLVLPLLLATRALLAPGQALVRRYTVLAVPVVLLLAAIIVSAAMRMKLYVHFYGFTLDRLNTLVFMGWLAVVLVLFAATVLRGREGHFVAGAMLSALAVLAALNVVVPDRIVARENLARSSSVVGRPMDVAYLASLGGEAADLAVAGVLRRPDTALGADAENRCTAARTLLRRWGAATSRAAGFGEDGAWRTWNAGERHATKFVAANAVALRSVAHETCAKASTL